MKDLKEFKEMSIRELRKAAKVLQNILDGKVEEASRTLSVGDILRFQSNHFYLEGVVMDVHPNWDPDTDLYESEAYSLLTFEIGDDGEIGNADWLSIKNPEYLFENWEKTGRHIDANSLREDIENRIQETIEVYLK